jgi:hypothetical protein
VVPGDNGPATAAGTGWTGLVDESNDGVWKLDNEPASSAGGGGGSRSPESSGSASALDCGTDANYDDKDYLYGVRCRQAARLPIIVEFDCPGPP